MSIKQRIIENLKGRVHFVNTFTALKGVDFTLGAQALKELVGDGMIQVDRNPLPGKEGRYVRGSYFAMYRLR